jgi:hypothetical protein
LLLSQGLLDSQLVALINKDYADFVNLSASILGTDVMINSVRASLVKVANEVNVVASSVESRSLTLQDRQAQLRGAEDARRGLQTLVTISQLLEELEELLKSGARRAVLDRIVAQFTELNFNVGRKQESKFVQELKPRLVAVEQSVERVLKVL